ncbi:PH domain-containing protein [Branchiibius sp. NY16-3462-2]|uniref:PH domain-containing protein n=1 Tax=Branchiibius sp. NY16-3462-2 TaxID=1807500 RepID=UPI00079BF619|nr:PH domain-containing protein [Branchiibius sp. NY16-3462-2]KYH44481.1 hypothetical protein AZH51_08195 [Branchiibius sp. NY16-3462-2]
MVFTREELTQGEYVVASLRTHSKEIWGSLLILLVTLVLLAIGLFYLHDRGLVVVLTLLVTAGVVIVIWVLRPVLRWYSTHFVVTNKRIITRHGVLSKTGRDIPLYRINDVSSHQGVLDRLLGCGTLVISDASQQAGLSFRDIPQVKKVQVEITQLLLDLHDGSDDDGTQLDDGR